VLKFDWMKNIGGEDFHENACTSYI